MNPEEKNQHYHNILAILRQKDYAEQYKAQDIVLYLENILKEYEIKFKEAQNNNINVSYSPSNFRGSFRRST